MAFKRPTDENLPGVELPTPNEPLTGKPGPYAGSGLRDINGPVIHPMAREWYTRMRHRLDAPDAPAITAAHPQLDGLLRAVGGLDPRWDITQPDPSEMNYSIVIPRMSPGPKVPEWPVPKATWWVDYPSLTRSVHKLPHQEWQYELKSKLAPGSQMLLAGIGEYALRHSMFRHRAQIFANPIFDQFDAFVVPDLSSYKNDPSPHALISERMTQIWAQEAHDRGKTVIPTVSWQNERALQRQLDLVMSLYPKVHTINIELLSRGKDRVPWLYERLDMFAEHFNSVPLRVLVSGVDHQGMVTLLRREVLPVGRFHLVTLKPFLRTGFTPGLVEQKARTFRRMIKDLEDLATGRHSVSPPPRPELTDDEIMDAEIAAKVENFQPGADVAD